MNTRSTELKASPLARIESGLPSLDGILGGGFVEGACYILQGSPGTGKTILANQICFAQAERGAKALYMTLLSESFSQMFGFLASLDFFDLTKVPAFIYYASVYSTLKNEGLGKLLHLIVHEVRERRPKVLVFDGIFTIDEFFEREAGENQFRRFLNELSALAAQNRLTIILITNSDRRPSSPEYTMVDGWIELIDDLAPDQPRRYLTVHKHRGGPILRGRHEYRIAAPGLLVYPRIETRAVPRALAEAPSGRLTSGIASLDAMMAGGVPTRSTTAVIGPTGSGKTTVGLHFLAAACEAEPALFFGFYEPPARLMQKAEGLGLALGEKVAAGTARLIWQPPGERLIDEIGESILHAVEASSAKRIVIDGLAETCRPLADEQRLRSFLRCLNGQLLGRGATVFYTYEVPRLFFPDELVSGRFSGLVDNTLLLHYALSGETVERRATLLKVRDSDFDHRGRSFAIGDRGLVLDTTADRTEAVGSAGSLDRRPTFGGGE
ncbi:RAD55 family ATPase [Jiella sonneratiae]|uniref:non-specific serine/threonine protein kinase n=1 Tax=Jiella sonneratiae TaxID=2816856 RepID=A0ABS3IZE3_9HYPH|nr:ATPase domain-containing protein [Jiella sonneratiae]MBO0902790.1 AAA family ATPase [Jiella sonneratiae]